MSSRRHRRLRQITVSALATATLLGGGLVGAAHAGATRPAASPQPVTAGSDYLALGDSVSFGYREPANLPTPNYAHAYAFTGYPENVGTALGLNVANIACSGETSTSLIVPGAPSNGCENSPGGGPGYRTAYPLHVKYSGTQLSEGLYYLKTHPDTRLVTLMIGANDAFLCEETTADGCASELPAVVKKIESNVAEILGDVRNKAGYTGQIVIVNYYSLDYSSVTDNDSSLLLNAAMDTAAKPYGVSIADGYGAFEKAAAQAGGNSCTAGLLTTLTTGGCGVHPSVGGQALLAQAVEQVVVK